MTQKNKTILKQSARKILPADIHDYIRVRGAAENNLKHISVNIPRQTLTVLTGLSGSGKSSLAFNTIFAEGQRRYMESLSSYARMFLGQMEKPNVENIEGLSPTISIDQKTTNRNPRSTVGTVTEIYDHFRLLYARIGIPHCPNCGREIRRQSVDEMADQILQLETGTKLQILAPVVRGKKGRHEKVFERAKRAGYVRVRVDGSQYDLSEEIELDKNIKHSIEIIVDRLVIKEDRQSMRSRLTDSIESALALASGLLVVDVIGGKELTFSQSFSCPDCGISIPEIEPRSFSFNNPYGACPECSGLGYKMEFDEDLMVPDKGLSLNEGAIQVMGWQSSAKEGSFSHALLEALAKTYHFSLDEPYEKLPQKIRTMLMHGFDKTVTVHYVGQRGEGNYPILFDGLIKNVEQRYRETGSDAAKAEYEEFMRITPCKACGGQRLKKESLAVTISGKNIYEITNLAVGDLNAYLEGMELTKQQERIGVQVLKEIRARVGFLIDVGLDYLTLSRATATLSGGEAQRIRLATQIGSGLVGVGAHGGEVVACGTAEELMQVPESVTGQYLAGKIKIEVPKERRKPTGFLKILGAQEHNLCNIDVRIPLGIFTCVTGVSGSGKSSLVNEILYKHLAHDLNRARTIPGKHKGIEGIEQLDKIINIDQSPIGRTPRSNPATYTGVFDLIRTLFAGTNDAKARGYQKGRFSFNVKGGRCEACSGDGIIKIEMHFLPDVYVPCEVCGGKRYNHETLEVKYKGKSIYDVLEMTVEEALQFFENVPSIRRKIQTLYDVGLGYVKLGQPSTELSGGEAQRIKLASELSRTSTGKTIYILDEPTTGLHFADVKKLVAIMQKLVESGNSVIVIEHNLDVIKCADYILDMGPEGGSRGGHLIAEGTPEEVAGVKQSFTGQYLKKMLR